MATRSRSKEAVFLVLAVTTLVTAVFTFRGHPKPVRHVRAAPEPATQQAAVAGKHRLGLVDPLKTMPMTNRNRNPFAAPPGAPKEALVMKTTPEAEPPVRVRTVVVPQPVPQTVPTFITTPVAPPVPQTSQASSLPPVGVEASSNKPFLSGIIGGNSANPTAIIREGNRRYLAKAGDTVLGKYRVQSITNQQVVLVADRERLILKMGGS